MVLLHNFQPIERVHPVLVTGQGRLAAADHQLHTFSLQRGVVIKLWGQGRGRRSIRSKKEEQWPYYQGSRVSCRILPRSTRIHGLGRSLSDEIWAIWFTKEKKARFRGALPQFSPGSDMLQVIRASSAVCRVFPAICWSLFYRPFSSSWRWQNHRTSTAESGQYLLGWRISSKIMHYYFIIQMHPTVVSVWVKISRANSIHSDSFRATPAEEDITGSAPGFSWGKAVWRAPEAWNTAQEKSDEIADWALSRVLQVPRWMYPQGRIFTLKALTEMQSGSPEASSVTMKNGSQYMSWLSHTDSHLSPELHFGFGKVSGCCLSLYKIRW